MKTCRNPFLLFFCCSFLLSAKIFPQNACIPNNAYSQYKCPSETVTVGAQTEIGSTYTWYFNGEVKQGPRTGTGNPISYDFTINTEADAGYYTIEKNTPGFPATCVFNTRIIVSSAVAGLATTSITANTVNFGWTAAGEFIYIVNTSPSSPVDPWPPGSVFTSRSNGSTNQLLALSTYHIHVRSVCDDFLWTTVSFSTTSVPVCPGSSTSFNFNSLGGAYTYQWQVDNGAGFVNISNGGIYSGATTTTLSLTSPPTSYTGKVYRCVATDGVTPVTGETITLKFAVTWDGTLGTAWENAANWNCGVLPDSNTDIIIPASASNMPVVNSNVTCKSLELKQSATLNVSPGFRIDITGY